MVFLTGSAQKVLSVRIYLLTGTSREAVKNYLADFFRTGASSRWPRHKTMVMKWMITGPRQEVWKFGLSFDGGFINNRKTSKAMRIYIPFFQFYLPEINTYILTRSFKDLRHWSIFSIHKSAPLVTFSCFSTSVSESQDPSRFHSIVDDVQYRSLTVNHFNQ